MGLLSIFQRGQSAASSGPDAGDPVQAARARARHRLIGAAVLVIVGVIGFPLVFETQPRPIPVDIPIEIPRRDGAPALVMPTPKPVTAAAPAVPASTTVAAPRDDVVTETKAEAAKEISTPPVAAVAPPAAAPAKAVAPSVPPEPKKAVETRAPVAVADSARAKALLEGKDTKPATKGDEPRDAGRFVVQVGAFSDAQAARDMRARAEKLGLKTYTQVVETSSGNRTRVRIGPFASREEADKAMARAKDAGLNAVVLTL